MKKLTTLIAVALLTGCAGLDVTYQLQANYISKELAAKRQAEADKARDEKRLDDIVRAQVP